VLAEKEEAPHERVKLVFQGGTLRLEESSHEKIGAVEFHRTRLAIIRPSHHAQAASRQRFFKIRIQSKGAVVALQPRRPIEIGESPAERCHTLGFLHKRAGQARDEWRRRLRFQLCMRGVSALQDISGEFEHRMLKTPACSKKRHTLGSGELNRA